MTDPSVKNHLYNTIWHYFLSIQINQKTPDMKKIFGIAIFAAALAFSGTAMAQEKTNAAQDVKSAGKKVGNKTAEIASKGASKVVDKTYKDKVGPDGETIYIDKHSKYYYVDSKGKHIYISKSELKDKM